MPRRTLGLRLGEREGVVVRGGVCSSMGRQHWREEESCKASLRARMGWISLNIINMIYTSEEYASYLLLRVLLSSIRMICEVASFSP